MKVSYDKDVVKWEYDGKNFEVKLDKILHAGFRESKNMIVIETGEGFVDEWLYYYTLAGIFLAKQNFETGEFIWSYHGEHQLAIPNTETVGFFPEQDLISVIYRTTEERSAVTAMKVFDLAGNLTHVFASPAGYTMLYITSISGGKARIACEAVDKANYDAYGRSRFHFLLDLQTKEWTKDGLAY